MTALILGSNNQKGGVGKTTTAVNLAAHLRKLGKRVLMVDGDPQASLTEYFIDKELMLQLKETMLDLLLHGVQITPIPLDEEGMICLLPATIDLAAAEIQLPRKPNFERTLKRMLRHYTKAFDYIIIDSPPSLGILTRNILTAVDTLLIPVQTEKMAYRTVSLILDHIDEVRDEELNVGLYPWRLLPTLYSEQQTTDKNVVAELLEEYKDLVYMPPVARLAAYKKAVDNRTDVGDQEKNLAPYWEALARTLIEETPAILARKHQAEKKVEEDE